MINDSDIKYLLDMLPVWGDGERGATTTECCEWLGLSDWEHSKGLRVLTKLVGRSVRRKMTGHGWHWWRIK
jgi:hypothetical protein